jgi:hypothetical protein
MADKRKQGSVNMRGGIRVELKKKIKKKKKKAKRD